MLTPRHRMDIPRSQLDKQALNSICSRHYTRARSLPKYTYSKYVLQKGNRRIDKKKSNDRYRSNPSPSEHAYIYNEITQLNAIVAP